MSVWSSWNRFENFLADMGEKPAHNYTLDRKDNAIGYTPDNCQWATKLEQARNRRGVLKPRHRHQVAWLVEMGYRMAKVGKMYDIDRHTIRRICREKGLQLPGIGQWIR